MADWLTTDWISLGAIALTCVGMYAGLILATRLGGLRSFSKVSGFDFAITVAIGSVIAGTVLTKDPKLLQALFALAVLYVLQLSLAALRQRVGFVEAAVDNQPLLLMAGPTILHDNLRRAKVTESDLKAKLREANVLNYDEVHAVVFESTGDVSVLHGEPGSDFDPDLLQGVRDAERL
jgi:uncharacterized membrane protein YcaP (DUF421 family)